MSKKVSKDRAAIEKAEGLKINTVDVPEERFQQNQQISDAMSQGNNSVEAEGFVPKKVKSAGHTLRQEVAAQVVTGKGAPGSAAVAAPASYGLKEISFSGDTGTILGGAGGTPSMGEAFQGKSRIDKRLSDANKDINFNASEQVVNEYDNIPPLAASESTVGYNGNPKNEIARMQKRSGFTPADIMFDRSLDFIEKDAAVFVTGQVVKQIGVEDDAYPAKTIVYDEKSPNYGKEVPIGGALAPRGNFMPRYIKVDLAKESAGSAVYVKRFEVIEDDLSTNFESDQVVNISATNHKIDLNRAELSRQLIDSDAGSPTAEHFNPLGRSVSEPTATVTLLQDIENATGATVYTAYKFANKARGHYLNRTAKDGQYIKEPAIDALYGHLYGANDFSSLEAALNDIATDTPLFSRKGNARGSAASLIYCFDSPTKYKTKGDLVNQPRGLKMHIQTADNNIDVFRCKNEFVAALNSIDAYSTIDHEYDPLSPVYITDNVRLVYPYSWEKALKYRRDKVTAGGKTTLEKVYESTVPAYSYYAGSGMNSYIVAMADPVLNGVAYFIEQHAAGFWNALVDSRGEGKDTLETTLLIPTVHSTTHFSLWDLIVCASTPYIMYERTNTMKDILDYEMFYKYPFQGNVRVGDAQPTDAVNYGNPSTLSPLVVKQMLPSSALRWKYPEVMINNPVGLMLPFYFNERSYRFEKTGKGSELIWNGECNFTTPVVRSGVKLGGLDDFFGMEVKDVMLLHDVMTRVPGPDATEAFKGCIYKYSNDSDGCVIVDSTDFGDLYDANHYYSTPRQLGWYFDLPAGVGCVYGSNTGLLDLEDITFNNIAPSFRAVMYKGASGLGVADATDVLQAGSVNVGRAQSFKQDWFMKRAGLATDVSDGFDLLLSTADCFKSVVEGGVRGYASLDKLTQFMPYMFGPYSVAQGSRQATYSGPAVYADGANTKPVVFSLHRALWAICQKMCFVINPFDNAAGATTYVDPFMLPYIFGLAGFMAANYDEEVYNRINEVMQQGFGYTHDPMTAQSPVFKDGYKYTQIG